jgi:endoglycosylceramidase
MLTHSKIFALIMLGRRGIYTIVDFHQDLLMRSCCGEGIPLWAEEVLLREIDNATKPFPWPVADPSAYQAPEDGEVSPLWSQCEQLSFLRYYFSAKVGAAFQGLYDNAGGVRDALGDYWRIVAETFSSRRSVLGYNLINEPWAGDIIQRPRLLAQPGLAERVNLQPLYNHLHSRIREVDDDHILFYEGFSWSYWPNGFDELPSAGSQGYEDRNALSYHIYCPLTDQGSLMSTACEPMNRQYFRMRDEDVMRIGGGSMMTEWGAVPHSIDHIRQMNQLGNMADEFLASWAYWSFKDYADVTTINGGSQALYEKNGLVPEKLAALARTFAHAVAGELHEMAFDPESKVFNLVFTPSSAASRDFLPMQRWIHQGVRERPSTTVIAVAMGINYPHGFNVDFDPPGSVSLLSADACAGGDKVYIENGRARVRTRVTIRPCEKESTPASCLCPAEAQSPPPFVLGINSFENMLKPPPFVNIKK